MPWSCIDAAPGCRALRRSSINILTAWPGRVAQVHQELVERVLLGPAHHVGAPSREPHGSGTSYSSTTNRTRKSPTEVPPGRRLTVAPPSAIGEFTSSSSPSWSSNRAVVETSANVVSRTRECAIDPLLVPALLALATRSICCWTSAAARDTLAQHRCNSTALRLTAGCSARASELSNLAPRLRPARRTVAR